MDLIKIKAQIRKRQVTQIRRRLIKGASICIVFTGLQIQQNIFR